MTAPTCPPARAFRRLPCWCTRISLASLGLGLALALPSPLRAHGAAGGEDLAPGVFQISPVLTLEGHAGLENNLEDQPRHYALDGLVGVVLEWGLPNQGNLAIEAMVGPALVWGEAEHFYGRVHLDHSEEHPDEEADHEAEAHGHRHGGAPFRRSDLKAQLQLRYAPNQRLSFFAEWLPYYVTRDQGEDQRGLKNELGFGVAYAFGDGDVNFALGDGLETIADGIFVSVENRTGWESDGTTLGNYTDPWLGFGFNIDQWNVTLSGGPRFYSPGSYAGLPSRTDWGGEVELEFPLNRTTVLFAHWKPIYSSQAGEGWGRGWQHHIGTGVTFRF
ncbi:MAG: hypothetical protein VKO39_02895 [Cyanobacteriota bacterium]|nr:hypothetical protein [Cyanobacteriota bacterium]